MEWFELFESTKMENLTFSYEVNFQYKRLKKSNEA